MRQHAFLRYLPSADNVQIHSCKDPLLTKEVIGDGDPWQATTTFNQDNISANGRRLYEVTTDSYVLWFDHDDFDYFYTPYYFGYGRKASMTIETTVNSWDMPYSTASAGIAVRSSLDKSAATAFLHVRESSGVVHIYRASDNSGYSAPVTTVSGLEYPIRLKMEIQNHKVKCYYATARDDNYIEIPGSYAFNYQENLMVGFGTHSSVQKQGTAVYEGLEISITAPEGTEYKKYGEESGEGDTSGETSSVITLPEDLPITDDVLFAETFTDGSITEGEESVTNHIWSSSSVSPNGVVQLDEKNLNRYMLFDNEDNWFFAGDQTMSDYSLNLDVNFSEESPRNESNNFRVYVRHRYTPMTGHYYYYIDFKWDYSKEQGQRGTITLCKGYHNSNPVNGSYVYELENRSGEQAICKFDYLDSSQLGIAHNLQVDVIDNKITVFWDGEQIAYGEDTDTSKFFNGMGNIGFYSNLATVSIDNIYVRTIEDYLGGNYDNKIGGKFDEKTPDYIETYDENGWVY